MRTAGQDALKCKIDEYRGSDREYDCLVALSGGRDSTYVLYYAVKVLELKVLAFTIDNGFMPQQTRDNIQKATRTLGVDHVVEQHSLVKRNVRPFFRAWLRRPSAAMVSFLCTGCRLGLYRGFLRAARRYQIPLVVSGLGEPESGFATRLLSGGASSGTKGLLRGLRSELSGNPRYLLLRPSLLYWVFMEYLYAGNLYGISAADPMKKLVAPTMHHLKLFEYIPWDEQEILSVIRSELGWSNYEHSASSWRSDCKVNLLKNHLYYRTLGFSKNDELVSNLIRLGAMTRDEGLSRVERENAIPQQFLSEFLQEMSIPYNEYERGMGRINAALDAAKE